MAMSIQDSPSLDFCTSCKGNQAQVYPDALPIPAESQETELQQRRAEQGLQASNCAVIFAHGYLGSRFEPRMLTKVWGLG